MKITKRVVFICVLVLTATLFATAVAILPKNSLEPSNISKNGIITGTITINYATEKEMEDIFDDIVVSVSNSKKKGTESAYFGATTCSTENDNCNWLISSDGNRRVYRYKLTRVPASNILVGENYILEISSRHYTDKDGNFAFGNDRREEVTIPNSGISIEDFNLTVGELL